jgi:hypothetical protein
MKSLEIYIKYALFILLLKFPVIVFCQNNSYEIIYENFSDSVISDFKRTETKYYSSEISISYSLPFYNSIGVHKIETGDNTLKQVKVRPVDTVKNFVYKDFKSNRLVFEAFDEIFFYKKNIFRIHYTILYGLLLPK